MTFFKSDSKFLELNWETMASQSFCASLNSFADKDFCAKAFGDLARFGDKFKGRGATKDEVDENEFGLRILAEAGKLFANAQFTY